MNENGIIVDTSLPETQLRSTVVEKRFKFAFLCDKMKIGVSAPYNFVSVSGADYFIKNYHDSISFLNHKGVIFAD